MVQRWPQRWWPTRSGLVIGSKEILEWVGFRGPGPPTSNIWGRHVVDENNFLFVPIPTTTGRAPYCCRASTTISPSPTLRHHPPLCGTSRRARREPSADRPASYLRTCAPGSPTGLPTGRKRARASVATQTCRERALATPGSPTLPGRKLPGPQHCCANNTGRPFVALALRIRPYNERE